MPRAAASRLYSTCYWLTRGRRRPPRHRYIVNCHTWPRCRGSRPRHTIVSPVGARRSDMQYHLQTLQLKIAVKQVGKNYRSKLAILILLQIHQVAALFCVNKRYGRRFQFMTSHRMSSMCIHVKKIPSLSRNYLTRPSLSIFREMTSVPPSWKYGVRQ